MDDLHTHHTQGIPQCVSVLCSSARVLCAVSAVQLGVSVLGLGSLTRLMPGQFFSRRLGLSATATVTLTLTGPGRGEQS